MSSFVLWVMCHASYPLTPAEAYFPWPVCRFGNAISLWLGMQPAEVFFYVFLPPLLLDSAVRVDYFLFKKVIRGGWKGCASDPPVWLLGRAADRVDYIRQSGWATTISNPILIHPLTS